MSGYIQTNHVVTLLDAAKYAVQAADSGKTLLIPIQSQNLAITLPSVQAGLRFRFMSIAISAFTKTITPTNVNTLTGTLINLSSAVAVVGVAIVFPIAKSASATVQFTATSGTGDYIDLNCNGSIWYISGLSYTVAGGGLA